MKLKAPQGAGDPCVAGVPLTQRDGVYDVEQEVGALLIECFGFVAIEVGTSENVKAASAARRAKPAARKI
jgi:hypothetical protein